MELRKRRETVGRIRQRAPSIRKTEAAMSRSHEKKWRSYSSRKQNRMLVEAERRADKKLRYQKKTVVKAAGEKRGIPKREKAKYQMQMHGQMTGKRKAFGGSGRDAVVLRRAPAIKRQAVPPQLVASVRTAQAKEPAADVTAKSCGRAQTGPGRERKPDRTADREWAAKREQYSAGQGKPGRKERQRAKQDGKKHNRLLRSEIMSMIDRDIQKDSQIRQMQRREQAEATFGELQEREGKVAVRIVSTPLRWKIEAVKLQVLQTLADTGAAALKYAVLIVLPLLLCMLLILILSGLLGGMAGEEENQKKGSTYNGNGYEIVEYASQWIGITKYIWGAGRSGPTSWQQYADCSSFVHGVFAHFGYEIGGTTYAQEAAGTLVEGGLDQALPGDIILFYSGSVSPGNSSHVGIYIGNGQMVHCSGGQHNYSPATAGRGVCIGNPAADGRRFVVRRIVQNAYGDGTTLLAILKRYNDHLQNDRKQGIDWYYSNSGTALTWKGAVKPKGVKATNCALLARWALKEMGILEKKDFFYYTYGNTLRMTGDTEKHLKERTDIIKVNKTAAQLIASGKLQPGDICCWHGIQHVNIYAGGKTWYDAGRGGSNGSFRGDTYYFTKWGPVQTPYMSTQVDYIIRIKEHGGSSEDGAAGTGYRRDNSSYSPSQIELIWAIVAQEDNGSYAGALAVISSAMNRTDSSTWGYLGSTALAQLTAAGQYCYSNDNYWRARLGGNVPDYVKQAVNDCLKKGIRNHPYTSFRSRKGSATGLNAVQIGGNWYFGK